MIRLAEAALAGIAMIVLLGNLSRCATCIQVGGSPVRGIYGVECAREGR